MNPKRTKHHKKGPESKIQTAITKKLKILGWYVKVVHGSMYQSGLPDLFTTHSRYGARWIEVKKPNMKGSYFTPAQMDTFPKMIANGTDIWILTGDSNFEFDKLFKPGNFHHYLLMIT